MTSDPRILRPLLSTLLLGAFVAGCGSSALPPRLAPEQLAVAQGARYPVAVAVEPDRYPVYSERLVRVLRESGVFTEVGREGEVRNPQLIARIEEHVSGAAIIPLFTAITLGVIPTIVDEDHGYIFSLRSASEPGKQVLIDASYRGKTTLGWYALLKNISPRYTIKNPVKGRRYQEYLRWALGAQVGGLLR